MLNILESEQKKLNKRLRENFPRVELLEWILIQQEKRIPMKIYIMPLKNKQADILIGTQMVAKGLDFENVTLVGVIAADLSLNLPDYRASERTFQLLTQVSGRAGRGKKVGNVIVKHIMQIILVYNMLLKMIMIGFFNNEIKLR